MTHHDCIDELPEPMRTVAQSVAHQLEVRGYPPDRANLVAAEQATAYIAERGWDSDATATALLERIEGIV